MWSSREKRRGTQPGDDKRNIPAFDTFLFHSSLSSLRQKYLGDIPTGNIVLECGSKSIKKAFKNTLLVA